MNKTDFEEPIRIPKSPFWAILSRFGRDELLALILSVSGTALLAVLTSNPLWLALAGPLIEKVGFFPAHFKEAYDVYRTTPDSRKRKLSHYVKQAFKGGLTSLVEDVLIHDPIYIAGVYFGLLAYPSFPAWILAAGSFVVAIILVALLEVTYVEVRFWMLRRRLTTLGFRYSSYYESHFVVRKTTLPTQVLAKFSQEFHLTQAKMRRCDDTYFADSLPSFASRRKKLRYRRLSANTKKQYSPTVEISYTRPFEQRSGFDQYRFFPIRKDLFSLRLDTLYTLDAKTRKKVEDFLCSISDKSVQWSISFTRYASRSDDLFVSADVFEDKDEYILELKVKKDTRKLVQAMRFAMHEYPLLQTTRSKSD